MMALSLEDKVRENRARRAADRQGLKLVKSRSRDENAVDYGKYALLDAATSAVLAGVALYGRFAFDLTDVEDYLSRARDHEREALARALEAQGRWREMKAEEYPEDARNQRWADRAFAAADYVRLLRPDNGHLRTIADECYVDDMIVLGANASRLAARIEEDPEMFLVRLAEEVSRDAEEGRSSDDDE